ncbi:nitrate reductase [Algicella marina]|uniref:Molybdopterin-dependent oxidoreductase n=1 Tax=Algicella marina TaxID=2683284 RepID=A0A6P1T5B8_9RHOB|nr:nitrate reductase [Algicella marina]QHQ36863.1 molybdopterin-dependent oxidoreductase [Algicella marina]
MSGAGPIRTTCPYCGVGCGVLVTPDGKGGATVAGDTAHPANYGRLCSKGLALGETLGLHDRILAPRFHNRETDWDEALDTVAEKFSTAIRDHGPDSVAFYVSGQFLTEDYYVANKLMKGYIGSANIDTNSRLCMASSVAGHKRAFGADTVPGTYEDLEEADVIVLVGSNLAWCHPVLFQRILAARQQRPITLVTVDPRRTATAESSDMHLAIAPGTDTSLFNGLLHRIAAEGAVNGDFVTRHVEGLSEAVAAACDMPLEAVASVTGVDTNLLDEFFSLWTGTEKVVTVYSQGVNQASDGTDKVSAIINCHLATGRIGRPGMGPFSVTGQPNAMGGREVGGLSNMLAAHLDIENSNHRALVRGFWNAPAMPEKSGLKAVDMFDACATGQIKALWIMCTNPAVSLPRANHVRDAIEACDFVVVSDITETDTTRIADLVLPATGWGEKDGTVTNSERRISRQRPFLPAPGVARHDWQAICGVARRMGFGDAFDYQNPAEIFAEHAALSGLAARAGRDFDVSGFASQTYDDIEPQLWPSPGTGTADERFFADGGFYHPDGMARMVAVHPRTSPNITGPEYPFILNTGRIRDQWHTMTRTARSARLSRHLAEPFVEIHPDDAHANGIAPADLVEVASQHGGIVARALVTDRTPRGTLFAPMHWTAHWTALGRVDAVMAAVTDPTSGQPELKRTAVCLRKATMDWHAFAVTRNEPFPAVDYWAKARADGGWTVELAGTGALPEAEGFLRQMAGAPEAAAMTMADPSRGGMRVALFDGPVLVAALFLSRRPVAVSRAYLADALKSDVPDILPGHPGSGRPDPGAIVCSCFGVGINTIREAIVSRRLTSVAEIGEALQAGTNCGTCRAELKTILDRTDLPLAAE